MTLNEIKAAVEKGFEVFWRIPEYKIVKDNLGQWLIVCALNNSVIGLTWSDGVTLNGDPDDFYIKRPDVKVDIEEIVRKAEEEMFGHLTDTSQTVYNAEDLAMFELVAIRYCQKKGYTN